MSGTRRPEASAHAGDEESRSTSLRLALAALAANAMPVEMKPLLSREELSAAAGRPPLQVQLLANRGIRGAAAIEAFFATTWQAVEPLPQLADAVERLLAARERDELVFVYGDCDADGMTSCALLTCALRAIGLKAHAYIPRRDDDGRGLNLAAVEALAAQGAALIVTTDCGTANVEEATRARELGVDVIVTDHHPPHGATAPVLALVNPQLAAEAFPDRFLSGAGVAFRVAEAVLCAAERTREQRERILASLLDLAALGTVADIVPLTPRNWALVRAGLERLRQQPRPGVAALMARAGIERDYLTEQDITFGLAPRLNAGARLDRPELSLALLLAEEAPEAQRLAGELEQLNVERQRLLETLLIEARQKIQERRAHGGNQNGATDAILIVEGEGWPLGLIGLVASRLVDECGVPAIALSKQGTEYRGSARSRGGVDLGAMLGLRPELFRRFGGHERAAGFTLAEEQLAPFLAFVREHMRASSEIVIDSATDGADVMPVVPSGAGRLEVDAQLPFDRLREENVRAIRDLAPFGPEFPEPIFEAAPVRLVRCWASGPEGRNLRLILRQSAQGRGVERRAYWPRHGQLAPLLQRALPELPPLRLLYALAPARPPLAGSTSELALRVLSLQEMRPPRRSAGDAPGVKSEIVCKLV